MSSNDRSAAERAETRPAQSGPQADLQPLSPGLYIVSTPIGNLRDITLRALDTLAGAEEVLAEDTRVARKLLAAHGLAARLTAYHDHNAARRRPELIHRLKAGAAIALISDAGTPLVSDPGYKLVQEAAAAGVRIFPVPGASAMLAGLVASGLPSDRFLFAGFLPAKAGARRRAIAGLAGIDATLILYEGASRLPATLAALAEGLGTAREAVVARELTKMYEETRRAPLGELAAHYADAGPPKGEIVILIAPPQSGQVSEAEIEAALRKALADHPTRRAADDIARRFGVSRREAYQRAIALKDDDAG